jgi:hypothetical protein
MTIVLPMYEEVETMPCDRPGCTGTKTFRRSMLHLRETAADRQEARLAGTYPPFAGWECDVEPEGHSYNFLP